MIGSRLVRAFAIAGVGILALSTTLSSAVAQSPTYSPPSRHRSNSGAIWGGVGAGLLLLSIPLITQGARGATAPDDPTLQPGPPPDRALGPPPTQPTPPPPTTARFRLPRGETRFVPTEVLVEVGAALGPAQVTAIERQFQLTRLQAESFPLIGRTVYRFRIPNGSSVPAVLAALGTDQRINLAQPNYLFRTPKGEFRLAQAQGQGAASVDSSMQYALSALRLPEAHQLTRGERVLVAVIDSAIDTSHPDLDGAVRKSVDATGLTGRAAPHEHGTGMAGAVVSHTRLLGAAPEASILALTAFRPEGTSATGTTMSVLRALDIASTEGARVVNMSFAGPKDGLLTQALAAARQRGAILVAAAGNAGPKSPPLWPGADPNVIAVTAIDADSKVFAQANQGKYVAVAAPGVDVLVPAPGNTYAFTTGTSVASAYVAGVVALMVARDPLIGADDARALLETSARDLGAKGKDPVFGAGETDAYAVVQRLQRRTATVPPAGSPLAPPRPAAAR